jgi:hypothetical protein
MCNGRFLIRDSIKRGFNWKENISVEAPALSRENL